MSDEPLPEFRYHPDPIGTGSIVHSEKACIICDRVRGSIYDGVAYSTVDGLFEVFCPWCIADGSAAGRYDATFSDEWAVPDDVPADVVEEIARRTPAFSSWQGAHWLYHCGDGAAFLGHVGWTELQDHPEAIAMLRHEHDELAWGPDEVQAYLEALEADGEATAYLFRCRHCGTELAYSDFS